MGSKASANGYTLFNRELSWLRFNRRVQAEADNPADPLLERAKFLAIATSNLDEFMQVRYVGILNAARDKRAGERAQGDMTPQALYRRVNRELLRQQNRQYLFYEGIQGELYLRGVQIYPLFPLSPEQAARVTDRFLSDIAPHLSPVALVPDGQGAPISQKQLHFCLKLVSPRRRKARFVLVPIPASLPRLYELSQEQGARRFIRLEDVVRRNLRLLFPKEQIEHAALFRILRNQDFPLQDAADGDAAGAVRAMLAKRRTGEAMRLEAEERMSEEMITLLMRCFGLSLERRYRVTGPLDLNKLMMTLYGQLDRPELKFPPMEPIVCEALTGEGVFEQIARRDILLYHPYHSFAPIVDLMRRAARDPAVTGIKQTLYRVSRNSPIVQALVEAAERGKQVTVLLESQARFDEENNLFWGERLRRAGCNVLFGRPGVKTHSKITLITRTENDTLARYVHLSTGNYHDATAKLYTDFGLLTADAQICDDACSFFYELEGRVHNDTLMELVRAPEHLKTALLMMIERECEHALAGRPAGIVAKMNALVDETIIGALYQASRAGVPVDLIVRGACCLVPGRAGMSENIRVTSIIGRQLEHARAFRFVNGGESELYLSSADWMPRNLMRRVELMFPVKDERCKREAESVLSLQLRDNVRAWELRPSGRYIRKRALGERVDSQRLLTEDLNDALNMTPVFPSTRPATDDTGEPAMEEA